MVDYKVVITGPESTGKTTLAKTLATVYKTVWIPEFARDYITKINRPYCYEDLEYIAREQIRLERVYSEKAKKIIFYDTHLILTKIWFKEVYGEYPAWIDTEIERSGIDFYLVCNTDIEWVPDMVRENGGEKREELLKMYVDEIEFWGSNWALVSGLGEDRISSAIKLIKNYFTSF